MITYERAIDELRRQMGIVITQDTAVIGSCLPVEFLDENAWQTLSGLNPALLLTPERAHILGIQHTAEPIALSTAGFTFTEVMALANPVHDAPVVVPQLQAAIPEAGHLLKLAKNAALLPALLWFEQKTIPQADYRLEKNQLSFSLSYEVMEVERAPLPMNGAENTMLISYRAKNATSVHLALVVGDIDKIRIPLVRVHSSCVTGDIFGSLRCDCGNQLSAAIDQIKQEGSGLLIYLHQEGRGIGIANKLRAYRLQDKGYDTYEANHMLGFGDDERDFSIAASILKKLGIKQLRLLTNNPKKIGFLNDAGITVSQRVALICESNEHNKSYLGAKHSKAGHLF